MLNAIKSKFAFQLAAVRTSIRRVPVMNHLRDSLSLPLSIFLSLFFSEGQLRTSSSDIKRNVTTSTLLSRKHGFDVCHRHRRTLFLFRIRCCTLMITKHYMCVTGTLALTVTNDHKMFITDRCSSLLLVGLRPTESMADRVEGLQYIYQNLSVYKEEWRQATHSNNLTCCQNRTLSVFRFCFF